MHLLDSVAEKFKQLYGGTSRRDVQPVLVQSPGRVNLLGEHTDYNFGYVLPAAIDKAIYLAIAPRDGRKCRFYALNMNEEFQFELENLHRTQNRWFNYPMGVVNQFSELNCSIRGFDCVFGGDIPIGAGLSSSAALEAGLAFALNYIFELQLDDLSLVKLAQKAENEFVGVQCGIMDQFANIFGKQEHALQLDCRSLEYRYHPFDFENISIVLFNTRKSHSLASSEYNRRKTECRLGVSTIQKNFPHVRSLRDVSAEMLIEHKSKMEPQIFRRCKYVIEENLRVLAACNALLQRDAKTFGSLLYATHEGLRREYEVSCDELDFLVELARGNPKVYGARMMGGGFGGCTINLIESSEAGNIAETVTRQYKQKFDIEPETYVTAISNGTHVIDT
ncbi:MAG: galactokinase [Bacteroidota bacterium]|nr:galactokinase [Bacteroidota bacterium]